MSVNGVTGSASAYAASAYSNSSTTAKKTNDDKTQSSATDKYTGTGVVYEKSMSEEDRVALVNQLKADQQARMDTFKSMVTDMLVKQGISVSGDDIWKTLAGGKFTVTPEIKKAAQEAISEDGEWGVEKTSDRMFEMAKALSGGDSEKLSKMMDAFKEGFRQAEEMWGGKLPEISYKTYDAMFEKYEKYVNGTSKEETEA